MSDSIITTKHGKNWSSLAEFQFFLLLIATLVAGCNPDEQDNSGDSFDREAFLINSADNLIIPAYQEAVVSAENLCIALWDGTLDDARGSTKRVCGKMASGSSF